MAAPKSISLSFDGSLIRWNLDLLINMRHFWEETIPTISYDNFCFSESYWFSGKVDGLWFRPHPGRNPLVTKILKNILFWAVSEWQGWRGNIFDTIKCIYMYAFLIICVRSCCCFGGYRMYKNHQKWIHIDAFDGAKSVFSSILSFDGG